MNDFEKYIKAIIEINPNNNLTIEKENFMNNSIIVTLCSNYNYNEKDVENFYKFTLSLIKLKNDVLINYSKFPIVKIPEFCIDLFNAIRLTYNENIEYLGNMYINYLTRSFKYEKFIQLVKILYSFKEKIVYKYYFFEREDTTLFIDEPFKYHIEKYNNNVIVDNPGKHHVKREKNTYIIDDLGKILYEKGLAKKIPVNCKDEYVLNDLGKKFYELLFITTTKKEEEMSSKLINSKRMSKKMSLKKHKKYYKEVCKRIDSNEMYKNIAYKREGDFKYFFNEYKVLIDYANARYGEKCKIRFCGNKTNKKYDYDGVTVNNHVKEFIQITTISHSKEEKKEKEKIINYGCGSFKIERLDDAQKRVLNLVRTAIEKKNDKLKNKVPIKLLVQVDCFDGYFIDDIANEKYFSSIFDSLKNNEYKFKKIDLIVNGYLNDTRYIEPWVITIK